MLSGFWAPHFCHSVTTNKMTPDRNATLFFQTVYLGSLRDNKNGQICTHERQKCFQLCRLARGSTLPGPCRKLCSQTPLWARTPRSPYESPNFHKEFYTCTLSCLTIAVEWSGALFCTMSTCNPAMIWCLIKHAVDSPSHKQTLIYTTGLFTDFTTAVFLLGSLCSHRAVAVCMTGLIE